MSSVIGLESIIHGFVDSIHPAFATIVVDTAFSSSLFTLFVVLLALSTKESRRRLVFQLNVFAICFALTMGVLIAFESGKAIVGQSYWLPQGVTIAGITFVLFLPLLCDSILLTRFFALYPLSTTPPITLLKIFAFPICIKCARVVVLTLFLVDDVGFHAYGEPFFRNPDLIAEWTMQIADNTYSVSLFLCNLHARTNSTRWASGMPARIRQIFYIAAANFVFPLIFNMILIIFITTVAVTEELYVVAELLVLTNSYIAVMGVLCATIWFSRSEWVRTRNEPLVDGIFLPKLNLGRVHDNGIDCGSETIVVGKRSATPNTADLDAGPITNCPRPATPAEEERYCMV